MPPFEIKPIEIPKISENALSGERPIFHLSERPVSPTLTSPGFTPQSYALTPQMEIDPSDSLSVRFQTFEVTEAGLVPLKNFQRALVKKGNLDLTKAPFSDRYAPDFSGVLGGAITGGTVGGLMYLLGAGLPLVTLVASVITGLGASFGLLSGMILRWDGTPGFEIPIDVSGNHYAIGTYPHPWLPIRQNGDLIAYPVEVRRIEGERVEALFKIFGLPRPFTLTMSESYARYRRLIPGRKYPEAGAGYYLIWGFYHRGRREAPQKEEADENGVTPFRLSSRPSSFFSEGLDADFKPIRVYRLGEQPTMVVGKVRPVGALEVYQGGEGGQEKLRVHFQEFDPYLDSIYSEDFFSISLAEGLKMGLVLQDLNGMLRRNPAMTHVYVEDREAP